MYLAEIAKKELVALYQKMLTYQEKRFVSAPETVDRMVILGRDLRARKKSNPKTHLVYPDNRIFWLPQDSEAREILVGYHLLQSQITEGHGFSTLEAEIRGFVVQKEKPSLEDVRFSSEDAIEYCEKHKLPRNIAIPLISRVRKLLGKQSIKAV